MTGVIIVIDGVAMGISLVEAAAADLIGLSIMAGLCGGAGPETIGVACGVGFVTAVAADVAIASFASPIGNLENALGGASLFLTWYGDQGNVYYVDSNGNITGLRVGVDTVVSARNTVAGLFPESNFDFLVSASQFHYDAARANGQKPGGTIDVTFGNYSEILFQIFRNNWW